VENKIKLPEIKTLWFITLCTFIMCIFSIAMLKKISLPFHKDNFTHLIIATPPPTAIEQISIYGFESVSESQGSGLAIRSIKNETYILTADHFCQSFDKVEFYQQEDRIYASGSTMFVYDYTGNEYEGNIVFQEPSLDLCLVRSNMPISKNIDISLSMPKIGEKVYTVSSPLGISPDGVGLHFEGIFSGCDENTRECFFSIPATFGSSGSLILNSDGDVIAMIQKAVVPLNMISLGVGNSDIRGFLERASTALGVDLI